MPENKDQENFTDPDSRIMKHAGGAFEASYNGQTAVDDTAHIIVAAELINNASDVRTAPDAGSREEKPRHVSEADAGRRGLSK